MRVLITGAGGFLAGHLSSYIQEIDGIELRFLARAQCDLSKTNALLGSVLREFKPAKVFHLAGRISGSDSELDCDNRLATVNLFSAVGSECPAARIVLGSTTGVYADTGTATTPIVESQTANPRGAYAVSKYASERAALSYAEAGGWIVIARMSNPVGSNMNASLLCGTLARQIVDVESGKASAVTLRDLRPKRDFISAVDCARALWHLSECGERGEIYNVAGGVSISIAEIVDIYLRLARVRPIELRTAPAEGERSSVQEQWVSNAKLMALGWKAQETLRDAICGQLGVERARG